MHRHILSYCAVCKKIVAFKGKLAKNPAGSKVQTNLALNKFLSVRFVMCNVFVLTIICFRFSEVPPVFNACLNAPNKITPIL